MALLPLDQSTPLPDDGTFQLADLNNVDLTNADNNFGTTQLGLTDVGDLTAFAPDTNDYSQFDAASLGGTDSSQLAFADNTIPLGDNAFFSTPSSPDTIAFAGSDLGTADFRSSRRMVVAAAAKALWPVTSAARITRILSREEMNVFG